MTAVVIDANATDGQVVRPAANPKVRDFPPGTGIPFRDIRGLGGRERPASDLPVRRSTSMRRYPRMTVSSPGWLRHRARSGHARPSDS